MKKTLTIKKKQRKGNRSIRSKKHGQRAFAQRGLQQLTSQVALPSEKFGGTHSRKMNCHPGVEGQSVNSTTCYTASALEKIKSAYNQVQGREVLRSREPKTLYQEIKSTMNNLCHGKKEDCWLNPLPVEVKRDLDKKIFRPDQPRSWKKDPDEWLSNHDIANVLRQYQEKYREFRFMGPSPIDFDTILPEEGNQCVTNELCNFDLQSLMDQGVRKMAIIFNLSEHDEDGSHWVSLFVDIRHKSIFYFDSAVPDDETPEEIMRLVDKIRQQGTQLTAPITFSFHKNKLQHQKGNTECGMYSLYFIITLLSGRSSLVKHGQKMTLKDKIHLFQRRRIPDKFVQEFRNKYFNVQDI